MKYLAAMFLRRIFVLLRRIPRGFIPVMPSLRSRNGCFGGVGKARRITLPKLAKGERRRVFGYVRISLKTLCALSAGSFILVYALLYAPAVFAQEIKNPLGPGVTSFTHIINRIADFAVLLIAPISVLVILYAGILFMFSAGDVEKVKKAKKALLWAVVGLMIVLTGRGIISIIQDTLRGGGGGTFCAQNPSDSQCHGP